MAYCPSFINYFEITLNNINKRHVVSIGVISNPDKLDEGFVVACDEGTIRLYSNDGKVYNKNGEGIKVIEPFKKNDVIGCGFNLITNEIFFTVNGKLIEKKFILFGEELCHSIGFNNYKYKTVSVNFGNREPFKYDIISYLQIILKEINETKEKHKPTKEKWQLTVDFIMIEGKYF